jgi:sugar-phosphatase
MKRFTCRALLFDLDGVLVDSTRYVEHQWRRWAILKGLAPEPFLEVCHGRRAVETIRLAAPELDAEAEVASFVPDESDDAIPLVPVTGAVQLLQTLPPGSWAIATSGPKAGAVERLGRAGLPVPEVLIGAEDVQQGKPSPDVYLRAAKQLRVAPSDCVVVEDTAPGIEAGRAAGMPVIALTTTHSPEQLDSADVRTRSLASIEVRTLGRHALEISVLELEESR